MSLSDKDFAAEAHLEVWTRGKKGFVQETQQSAAGWTLDRFGI